MVTIALDFYPWAGLLVAALLYAAYYWLLRLRTEARWAQTYIAVAMLAATAATFVSLARVVERSATAGASAAATVATTTAPDERLADAPTANDATPAAYGAALPATASEQSAEWNAAALVTWLYGGGVVAMLANLAWQLLWCLRERRRSTLVTVEEGARVYASRYPQPFSFGHCVFLPQQLDADVRHYALTHELAHVRHRHFLRLCLAELLLAVEWFNPFVWLLFGELKLQQELEVDADVLAQGIDRQRYQLSLLQMTVQNSRWLLVQSAFGEKPIKHRIVFMNKALRPRSARRRMAAAMLAAALTAVTAGVAGCSLNQRVDQKPARHAPLYGIWRMDFTRPADTEQEIYPRWLKYAFYDDSTFFSPNIPSRDGKNMWFTYTSEELRLRNDTLVGADGKPAVYHFTDDSGDVFQTNWQATAADNPYYGGRLWTDQWRRATPAEPLLQLFRGAYQADQARRQPLDGVWHDEAADRWYLVTGDVLLTVSYSQADPAVYKHGGEGVFAELKYGADGGLSLGGALADRGPFSYRKVDADHLTISRGDATALHLSRAAMPTALKRMLATTLVGNATERDH